MRVITWNCAGAFRRKFHLLDHLKADVLVIQECEDPAFSLPDYRAWAGRHLWVGTNKQKGLGIFAKGDHSLELLEWADNAASFFLPALLDNQIQILGIWTQSANVSSRRYVGQLWHYLQENYSRLNEKTVLIGDFNSNSKWDKPKQTGSHSKCVAELSRIGLHSLYHKLEVKPHGGETKPTFYLQRNLSKAYHIDYIFAHQDLVTDANTTLSIGDPSIWLTHSDHLPLVCDIAL
jgi:exonuclease III